MTAPTLKGCRCQCAVCHVYFASERAFDRHRTGPYAEPGQRAGARRCLTVAEMDAAGWALNGQGFRLTPDPRRAGADIQASRVTLPATHVPGA